MLAYGADIDVRKAFQDYRISDFGLHNFDVLRLRNESGERGLLRDALTRAIGRCRGLEVSRRRSVDLLAPDDASDGIWDELRSQVGQINGTIKGFPELLWKEGIGTRLDWVEDRLWLVIEPRVVFAGINDKNNLPIRFVTCHTRSSVMYGNDLEIHYFSRLDYQCQCNRLMAWHVAARLRRLEKHLGMSQLLSKEEFDSLRHELEQEAPYKHDTPAGHQAAITQLSADIRRISDETSIFKILKAPFKTAFRRRFHFGLGSRSPKSESENQSTNEVKQKTNDS